VALAWELREAPTKRVRLFDEDLVVYRDKSGSYGLIDSICPHEPREMIYGVPQETGIRCTYHSWHFALDGECISQPYYGSRTPYSVRIKAYPVREMAGILFAYFGPEPAPSLEVSISSRR